ncbi:MAG: sugar transferase [Anaerolineae bacterium]|jgi:sugar transferase EpsL|nr:sugar transferase [Anaerolineae bacterium]MBT7192330.1 sugar transferase [Anaerolineae bacterium]MBT7988730.1 sugar transferase [Anaerolineae bacterium]
MQRILKRLFDLLVAFVGLLLFSPVLLIVAILVRFFHGTPILFKQERPGYKGKPFFIYKFRTMTNRLAPDGSLLPDAERMTRFGRFLRATSMDELPELLNILRGEMSLVGPRPLLMQYLPLYNDEQMRRHDALPGITGWAQINGRNNISWDEKFKLDLWYIDNQSFWLDMRILWQTFSKVFKREDVSMEGEATTTFFEGNK